MSEQIVDEVRAASKRERECAAYLASVGCPEMACYCARCVVDRRIIAERAPALLELIDAITKCAQRLLPPVKP